MSNSVVNSLKQVEKFLEDKKEDQFLSLNVTRIEVLKKIHSWILTNINEIITSLQKDLNKSEIETLLSEIYIVLNQITFYVKNIKKFFKEKKVRRNGILSLRSTGYVAYKSLGTTLIISPFNYPFHLSVLPLITNIAAGNYSILKNSPKSLKTSRVILKMIQELNLGNIICFLDENSDKEFIFDIISMKPDLLFYTGGKNFGDELKRQATLNDVKVILELGSASPVIVDESANIQLAAKRIVWGKLFNLGQTCVAPNSIFCDEKVIDKLISSINFEITTQYDLEKFEFAKIIDSNALEKITNLVKNLTGTDLDFDKTDLRIKPTIIKVQETNSILFEEIFGPVLFITSFKNLTDFCKKFKNKINGSLALYVFSNNEYNIKNISDSFQYGSLGINEVLLQVSNIHLPFGGVKTSGIGRYHGLFGLQEFSNQIAILKGSKKDISFRYFNKISKYKSIIKMLSKK